MVSTRDYLFQFGIGTQVAFDFIVDHMDTPQTIFKACQQYMLTTDDVLEIVRTQMPGVTREVVEAYFSAAGLDAAELDVSSVRKVVLDQNFRYFDQVSYLRADGSPAVGSNFQGNFPLLTTGDINNDGHTDLLFGFNTWNDNYASVPLLDQFVKTSPLIALMDPTTGRFQVDLALSQKIPAMFWSHQARIADFNRDGFNDIFLAGTGPDQGQPWGEMPILMLGSKDGLVDSSSLLPRLNVYTHQSAVADFNNDGRLDFLLLNNPWINASTAAAFEEATGAAYAYSGASSLVVSTPSSWQSKPISNAYINSGNGFNPSYSSVLALDYNRDGHQDLAISGGNFGLFSYKILFMKGNGQGEFAADGEVISKPFGDASVGSAITHHDFNGDGQYEILVLSTRHNGPAVPWSGVVMQIYQNDPTTGQWAEVTGTYVPTGDISNGEPGAWVKAVHFLDLDGDGDPDMLLSTMSGIDEPSSGKLLPRLLVNNGGYFEPQALSVLPLQDLGNIAPLVLPEGIRLVGSNLDLGLNIHQAYF